jgi:hypothetical protein
MERNRVWNPPTGKDCKFQHGAIAEYRRIATANGLNKQAQDIDISRVKAGYRGIEISDCALFLVSKIVL